MSDGLKTNGSDDNLRHHRTSLGSTAYSFYLNLVVLSHVSSVPEKSAPTSNSDISVDDGDDDDDDDEDLDDEAPKPTKKKNLFQLDQLDKSLQNTVKAMSLKSKAVGNKAANYVASKTMVTRAMQALGKSIPELFQQCDLDIAIGKRFQQGSVSVLQVTLKPTDLDKYVQEVKGEAAADQYRQAVSALHGLGATDTIAALEQEMLPKVRKGLMEKLSEHLTRLIKEKETVEVECIGLEEPDEARWLFTFMEFQTQMKK